MATGSFAGPAKLVKSSTDPQNKFSLDSKDGTQSFTYEYPTIPAQTTGTQTLICSGSIKVLASESPGSISASGSIEVFHEESQMTAHIENEKQKQVSSGRTGFFKTQPILINQGNPF